MSQIAAQNLNQHIEDIFNSFIYLFKFVTNDHLIKSNQYDEIAWRSVRWSVRLYFYVCYGLYANQFLQFIRKKDQNLLSKDFLAVSFLSYQN